MADGTKVDDIDMPKIKRAQKHSTKAVAHLPVSSETLIAEITNKNAEPDCVQQQTSEDWIQALNLVIASDVASESTPARDAGLQVALCQESEAADIECTQVPSTDPVDLCSSPNQSKPKAKSTRKRKANKESGMAGEKGKASGKEGACGDASEKEEAGADAGENDIKISN